MHLRFISTDKYSPTMKNKKQKDQPQTFRSVNSVYIEFADDLVHVDKLEDVLSVLMNFIPASANMIDEVLTIFASSPEAWNVFNTKRQWSDLSEVTRMERTINFTSAMKDYQYRK